MRLIDADALCEALLERWNTADQNAEEIISELMAKVVTPIVVGMPTIEPSEQYRKGFEDAKRAFELEYAKESENMRKRNAELEVLLNSYREISAEPSKSTDQNVADVPSGDTISRADAIEAVASITMSIHLSDVICDKLLALPSADRPTNVLQEKKPTPIEDYMTGKSRLVDRPKGEWIIRDDMPKLDNTYSIECSECGQLMFGHYNADNPNFCPRCGADMRPEK